MVGPGLRCAGGAAPTHVQPRAILGVPGGQDVVEAAERTRDLLHLVIAERVAVPRLEGRTDGADGFGRERRPDSAALHDGLPSGGEGGRCWEVRGTGRYLWTRFTISRFHLEVWPTV